MGNSRFQRALEVLRGVSLAVASQIFRASSTFIIPLVAARTLTLEGFAQFNVCISIFTASLAIFSSYISDPILTHKPLRDEGLTFHYLRHVDRAAATWATLTSILFGSLSALAIHSHNSVLVATWAGLALIAPPYFLAHARDRLFFAIGKPGVAMTSNALAVGTAALCVAVLAKCSQLNTLTLLTSVALGQAASLLQYLLRTPRHARGECSCRTFQEAARHHLHFGNWAVLGQVIWWAMATVFLFSLPAIGQITAAARLRIVQLVNTPAMLGVGAMALLATTSMTRLSASTSQTYRFRFYVSAAAALPAYALLLKFIALPALAFVIGHDIQLTMGELLISTALPWANSVLLMSTAGARSQSVIHLQVAGGAIGLVVGSLIGLATATRHGLFGAVLGQCLCYLVAGMCIEIALLKPNRNNSAHIDAFEGDDGQTRRAV